MTSMKKTKSASFLKIPSLGPSQKKSLQLEPFPTNRRLAFTRSTSQLVTTVKPLKLHYDIQTDATSTNQNQAFVNKPATVLRNKLASLHNSIQKLENQINENKKHGKNKSKDYDEDLKKYERIQQSVKVCELQISKHKQRLREIDNNIEMMREDFLSAQMNVEQRLAERQYFDQVIQQYKRQYQNQANVVLQLLNKQLENKKLKQQLISLEQQLMEKQKTLANWKKQIQFDLQQKVVKNKLTQLRIQLIKAEEEANTYADNNKLMKIRQILCVFIKQKAQYNQVSLKCSNFNQQGMQIFICKNNDIQQFQTAVYNYRGKQKRKYETKSVQKYFQVLFKIESTINNVKLKQNRKINQQYMDEICQLRAQTLKIQQKIKQYENIVIKLNEQIQVVFANDSVAIIQHLRQTTGRYDLSQIKQKLKFLKQQQKQRINKIKDVTKRYTNQFTQDINIKSINFMNNLSQFNTLKQKQENSIKDLQINLKNLNLLKQEIQNCISLAVSKWGEISCKKQQLKQLYKDLNTLNKEIRQAQMVRFQQKQTKNMSNLFDTVLTNQKKSDILTKTMRQTLKLRINGVKPNLTQTIIAKNKQNQQKYCNNKLELLNYKTKIALQENFKTRKVQLNNQKMKKTLNSSLKSNRDSLTAVLFSKLIN